MTRSGRQLASDPGILPAALVVPNVPSFAVDSGFWYAIPPSLEPTVGSIVRVPLSGRRVRGWVVDIQNRNVDTLKDVHAVSGAMPVFDRNLLVTLRWAANHYVAPMATILNKAGPPNLPKKPPDVPLPALSGGGREHPLSTVCRGAANGRKAPTQVIIGPWQGLDWLGALEPVLGAGKSAMVVAGTAAESARIGVEASGLFQDRVVVVAGGDDKEVTDVWSAAQAKGRLLIGTPRVATWPMGDLAVAVVLDEARRAMKERQTPTVHVREVIRQRSLVEGFTAVFLGPTPSVEVLATGPNVRRVGRRAWPLLEIVDLSGEPPGLGRLAGHTVAAIRHMAKQERSCFILSSLTSKEDVESELLRKVGTHEHVMVGTEADLAGAVGVALAVAVNPDGMLMGRGYRTSEETLRVLARLANTVTPGRGHRMIVQTEEPHSRLMETLRRGDPIPYLEAVLVERARGGLPPSADMVAIEVRSHLPEGVADALTVGPEVGVIGPLEVDKGWRWLVTGDLRGLRSRLREVVPKWRDAGATVRIDADPIDL